MKCLLTRCHVGKKKNIYFCSKAIADLVQNNEDAVKIINTGVKTFVRCYSKHMKCPFRLAQEGHQTVNPFIGPVRRIEFNKEDVVKLLQCSDPTKPPSLKELTEKVQKSVAKLHPESCVLKYSDDRLTLSLVGWRGTSSLRHYTDINDTMHLLRLLGANLSMFGKNKFKKDAVMLEKCEGPTEDIEGDDISEAVDGEESQEDSIKCEIGVKNKKGENETVSKTFVSNKTYETSNNYSVFRQPAAPFRRQGLSMENFRVIPNGFRYNHARLLMKSKNLASKQIVVQRLHSPVRPGMNQSYDVVTPQVHVRTIIDKSNLHMTAGSNNNQTKAGSNNVDRISISSKSEQSDSGYESFEQIKEKNVEIRNTSLNSHTGTNSRPFMARGKNDEVDATNDNINCRGQGAKTVEITSLSSKDDIFSTSSSGSSDTEENGFAKIINISEDPGIQQLMEISLPSPARPHCLDDGDICSIPPVSPIRLILDSPSDPK